MSLRMTSAGMEYILRTIAAQNEAFHCMLWGTVGDGFPCYIGCTDTKIYIACVNQWNTLEVDVSFGIPFENIQNIKIKKSIIPGRRIAYIACDGEETFKLSVMSNAIGTDIKNQKENADIFFRTLLNLTV